MITPPASGPAKLLLRSPAYANTAEHRTRRGNIRLGSSADVKLVLFNMTHLYPNGSTAGFEALASPRAVLWSRCTMASTIGAAREVNDLQSSVTTEGPFRLRFTSQCRVLPFGRLCGDTPYANVTIHSGGKE